MSQWGLFMAGGTILSLAHVLIVKAFQLAPGAPVSAMKYFSLVWAAMIGFMVWGDVPGPMKLLGAALVVAAGMFILYRETKRRNNSV
jgi:drug/metabolite transporter (DMT)-like permease